MAMEWARFWDFLNAIGELGQLGITICPGCAARLASPTASDQSGRQYHFNCFKVCGGCGVIMVRDNDDGIWTCRNDGCLQFREWAANLAYHFGRIAYQHQAETTAKARGYNLNDDNILVDTVIKAAQQKPDLRYASVDPKRWQAWNWEWLRFWQGLAARYDEAINQFVGDRKRFLDFWGLLQDQFCKDRKALRSLIILWKRLGAAHARRKARLLNEGALEQLEDPTERRFAQLEIE